MTSTGIHNREAGVVAPELVKVDNPRCWSRGGPDTRARECEREGGTEPAAAGMQSRFLVELGGSGC